MLLRRSFQRPKNPPRSLSRWGSRYVSQSVDTVHAAPCSYVLATFVGAKALDVNVIEKVSADPMKIACQFLAQNRCGEHLFATLEEATLASTQPVTCTLHTGQEGCNIFFEESLEAGSNTRACRCVLHRLPMRTLFISTHWQILGGTVGTGVAGIIEPRW